MSIRVRGIKEAVIALGMFHKNIGKAARTLQQEIAREMFVGIVSRTPVDTGFAMASWRMNTGSKLGSTADKQQYKLRSSRGQISFGAARSNAIRYAGQQLKNLKLRPESSEIPSIYITNNVPYIGLLEGTEGGPTSPQAPAGMVVVTKNAIIQRFQNLASKV